MMLNAFSSLIPAGINKFYDKKKIKKQNAEYYVIGEIRKCWYIKLKDFRF